MTWDSEKRQYRDDNGELISPAQMRKWVDDWAAALAALFISRARRVVEALPDVQTNPEAFRDAVYDWQYQTRLDIKSAHLAASIIAFGGLNFIAPEDFTTGERAADFQLSFFEMFVGGIAFGSIPIDNNFAPRTGMYGAAVYSTYENSVRAREMKAGMTEERRYRTAAESCPECIEIAGFGWSPIGSLPSIGNACSCKSNCRCKFEFR